MDASLLNLPWQVLLTLASGYAGYYVANVGLREHHKAIDIAFATLVFSFFAAFVYQLIIRFTSLEILSSSILTFAAACVIGAFWSLFGRNWLRTILRQTRVSNSDDLPTAWLAIFSETRAIATQLSIKTKDGAWLKCEDLNLFKDAPNGPCVFGGGGDILMYVTHIQLAGQDEFEAQEMVSDPEWGTEITYIPKDQVARVDLRRSKR